MIIALWSLCLLTTFAIALSYNVRQKIRLVQRLNERDQLRFITEAGIKRAIVELNKESAKDYSSLSDAWSNNIGAFKDIGVGQGVFSICYKLADGESEAPEVRYGLIDEERKININKASQITLRRLFHIGLNFDDMEAQELAASIVDWRDGDSALSIPIGSAEDSYYRNLQYAYEAKDSEFQVLEEVLLVRGMTREIFKKIKDYITIYGNGRVNINTASREVLLALGLAENIVDNILSFRCGEDEIEATEDDNIFYAPFSIVPKLSQSFRMSSFEIAQISIIKEQHLVTNSNNFMAKVMGKLDNSKNRTEVTCVINRKGKILYWQEL